MTLTLGRPTITYEQLQSDAATYLKSNPSPETETEVQLMSIQAFATNSHSDWVLSFNGTDFPPPTDYKPDYEPIVKAERNANGDMTLEYITEKRKLNLQWKRLRGDLYQKILQSRKGAKITGPLIFFDPQENAFEEMMAYASPISAPLFRYKDGVQIWENVAVNFIEM